MYKVFRRNWDENKLLILFGLIIAIFLLLTVVYKSDQKIIKKSESIRSINEATDLLTFKKFLLNQIKSPFTNLSYEIKKGDTIQKILKKYKVRNNEIQTVINQYKKYGNPNKLLAGNKIDIIFEKNPSTNKSSVIKFAVPITKSTTIAITKDEENNIISKKLLLNYTRKKFCQKIQLIKIFILQQWKQILILILLLNLPEFLDLKLIFKEI